jgi:predicted secreted hydrolase
LNAAGAVTPPRARHTLQFPRDLGSHPDDSIEWWYLTGRLTASTNLASPGEREFGFQLTFFRTRVSTTQAMSSRFAAKQLLFAHAAVTDVTGKKLLHDQRIARAGFGLAQASEQDTRVTLRDWSLLREATLYRAKAKGREFDFELVLQETQPLLLQGDQGWSRKGPDQQQASYYYSLPQLKASGQLSLGGQLMKVQGSAWLDHEWSQTLLPAQAVGWDWIGMNLLDGSALTAFQLRSPDGKALWSGGSYRHPSMGSAAQVLVHGQLQFQAVRYWRSPWTQASYPVEWIVRLEPQGAAGKLLDYYTVKAMIDAQELDSRATTGAVYWEGLSELFDRQGKLVGSGYLEMTGYAGALRLLEAANAGGSRPLDAAPK